jgi:hypothetical protein
MVNHQHKSQFLYKKRHKKPSTNKILDKLTYSPRKQKQKQTRKLRKELQQKTLSISSTNTPPPPRLKFGSFNVNCLDLEASWAIEELIKKRNFDVRSFLSHNICNKILIYRSLP